MDLSDSDSGAPLSSSRPQDSSSSDKKLEPNFPIVCRVNRIYWGIVWLGLFEATFMFSGPFLPDKQYPHSHNWGLAVICWPVGLLMAAGVFWAVLELLRGEVRADAEGVTWRRGLGGWKRARWDEISDFYQRYPAKGTRIVQTPTGKLELSSWFAGIERVMDLVPEKAVNAPPKEWELWGARPQEEWSRTFTPWSGATKWVAPVMTALVLSLVVLLSIPSNREPRGSWAVSVSSWIDVVLLLFTSCFLGLLAVLMVWTPISLWRDYLFAWRRRDETITLNAQGIVFSSSRERITARWDEVQGVTRLPRRAGIWPMQIETAQGNFIVWNGPYTAMGSQMLPLFKQYAPDALVHLEEAAREQARKEEDLQGERGAWSGGKSGVGARMWSYRSRGTRFLLVLVSFFLAGAPFFYLLQLYSSQWDEAPPSPSWTLFTGLCVMITVAIGAMWTWYKRAAVLADENGLELCSPFHRVQRLSWESIEGLGQDALGEFVRANGRKFSIARPFHPVRYEELREYIESRVGGAR